MAMTSRKRPLLIASGCLAAAGITPAVAAAASSQGGGRYTSFVTPRPQPQRLDAPPRRRRRPLAPPSAVADDALTDPDPLAPFRGDAPHLPSPPAASWGPADDWSRLSGDAAASPAASGTPFAVLDAAAALLAEQEAMMGEWAAARAEAVSSESLRGAAPKSAMPFFVRASDGTEDFAESAVDAIASHADYWEEEGVQLYDTAQGGKGAVKTGQDRHDDEMAFMIRCNQAPEQMLIDQGKALPELTEERKYSPDFLLAATAAAPDEGDVRVPLRAQATPFFAQAITTIFEAHAIMTDDVRVLDRKAISQWMTRCLSSPLTPGGKIKVGPYDQSVSAVLSRYSQTHGSGRLTHAEFQALYLEVGWSGYLRDLMHKRTALEPAEEGGHRHHPHNGGGRYRVPTTADAGVLIRGKQNTEKMLRQATVSLVWRDLEAHDVFSPAEEEQVRMLLDLERAAAERSAGATARGPTSQLFVDECLLFDDYADRLAGEGEDDDKLGSEDGWDFLARKKEKSSHQGVEMAFDGKTPKRIRDGQFVFIDEESCIGCKQCANIAPSSFKMIEDSGRARTFSQSNSLDVENAVMACPVSCMHHVSFDELEEMETARDDGDGRTDHRHFGGRTSHTPVHLSRRDSDANHKSSWYHYLKWKCHGTSCPDRGCYDCPQYAPGQNPFFKERHLQAELIRAKDFIESGEADKWRKVVAL